MINLADKFTTSVDEVFTTESKKYLLTNNDFSWSGAHTIKAQKVNTVAMTDYDRDGKGKNASRYGELGTVENSLEEFTLKKDRSFTFVIDKLDKDETQMVLSGASALARQQREVIIPEVDTYRISTLVAGAPVANVKTLATTKENAYEEFLAVQGILDDNEAPQFGRVVLCTPAYYNKIKLDESFTKKGDMATQIAITGIVGDIDGVPAIKAPTNRFPKNVDFIITNAIVMPSPVKLQEYKIHTDAPGISGWLVEGRVRYDAFVLKEKACAIGVHKSAE